MTVATDATLVETSTAQYKMEMSASVAIGILLRHFGVMDGGFRVALYHVLKPRLTRVEQQTVSLFVSHIYF